LFFSVPAFVHPRFGHAFAAKLLGFKVLGITIGGGKKRSETVVYGINLQINTYPTHGFTRMIPRGARLTRFKLWLSILGGPLTHIGFIAAILLFTETNFITLR
jgi:hypothetical protein